MSTRRVRSAFSPILENLPSRIAPTVFMPPPPIECAPTMPTIEISPETTPTYPNNALEMIIPATTI